MKIFDTKNIREADKITISNQGITSVQLMERASFEVFLWLKKHFADKETTFHIFCGQGNNGGDGLVVARLLKEDNYPVVVDIVQGAGKPTPEFDVALALIKQTGLECNTEEDYEFEKGKLIYIDAIFGIGINRELSADVKEVIDRINQHNGQVISIDAPSGLFMDKPTEVAVESDVVLTFHFPKLAFYLPGNNDFVNKIEILDIGLDKEFVSGLSSYYHLVNTKYACRHYRPVKPHAHKGTQGHALIVGGSHGKIGAVCLAAKAALKSGCGLVTAYLPECGYNIIQTSLPEAMALTDGDRHITKISFDLQPKAIGIGPGLGQHPETQQAFYELLKASTIPLVIDADALNILSYNKEWLSLLPQHSVLTPHPKELERLVGKWQDDFDRLEKIKQFSKTYNVIIVAKDSHTMVCNGSEIYINSTGNAALATGGTGDTLTGIITGLLAQGYPSADAAIFGVYLHGLTADIAVSETGHQAFTASDVINYTGKAYLKIEKEKAKF
ncbi:NAD(P)H-hydrate dehydratase [Flavobacterium sp. Sd200]|uniref:NAD(P)H-hydrate dehydratase n=1 Tax=Flavobacterium sp. Sd200 TaxID=2692211 RepID=UPI0013695449|nr:NAD(P)H-hydrate dehydratase [Flavobacterium sp. Sd200]MXN93108.1 NAD(P)H-hydrate dehydratase [Flavobacterium sp. Sd200]